MKNFERKTTLLTAARHRVVDCHGINRWNPNTAGKHTHSKWISFNFQFFLLIFLNKGKKPTVLLRFAAHTYVTVCLPPLLPYTYTHCRKKNNPRPMQLRPFNVSTGYWIWEKILFLLRSCKKREENIGMCYFISRIPLSRILCLEVIIET